MTIEQLLDEQRSPLTRRLARMIGRDDAEDLMQDVLLRAWRALPRDLAPDAQRAWLGRTARNAAIDELRRRGRWQVAPLPDGPAPAPAPAWDGPGAVALEALSLHERFILRLRFESGMSHAEIALLLAISPDAARKRVARARAAFARAYRELDAPPLILVLMAEDDREPYRRWLETAGARVRFTRVEAVERDLLEADGFVLSGSTSDIHPAVYGEPIRVPVHDPDADADRRDMIAVARAMRENLPFVGICRGHQLLNVISGGSLVQDLAHAGLDGDLHGDRGHAVETRPGSGARSLFGRSATVESAHHQAVARLGRQLRITAVSRDGVPEAIERLDRRFAVGLQWHPEHPRGGAGDARLAEALVEAARSRRAA